MGLSIITTALGRGVITTTPIASGQKILNFGGPFLQRQELPRPYDRVADHYMQIGPNLYLGPSGEEDDYFNHSCDPNAGIKIDGSSVALFAIRDIHSGDEITFDYSTTMDEHGDRAFGNWTMDCQCGSAICRRNIKDFSFLTPERQQFYIRLRVVPEYVLHSL